MRRRGCRIRRCSGRAEPHPLPKDAPNILIVLLDDVGFGSAATFGGEIDTPTLTRLAHEGISYNTLPHHLDLLADPGGAADRPQPPARRSGTIAERALDWDGYTGVIPKTSATVAEVLQHYGYKTAAFGKWHNTPATETTAMGPMDRWPTGYGFDYFYGFLAGETSQYEPRLFENYDADRAAARSELPPDRRHGGQGAGLARQLPAFDPDKPFLMYWAPGGAHGPHHVFKEWADKYKGKFDDGWDAYRERVYQAPDRAWADPAGHELTPRDETMAAWDSIPQSQRPFQERLMEVFAGFVEHTDTEVGRLIDGHRALGLRDNTLIFYIFGDNGSSAEGQHGTISELLAQNNIPNTVEQQIAALERIGGLEALGTARDRQHVPCGLGLGRRHAVQGHQADGAHISAARATRW